MSLRIIVILTIINKFYDIEIRGILRNVFFSIVKNFIFKIKNLKKKKRVRSIKIKKAINELFFYIMSK
jgi:hypothetical protein